ncbi:hypothetical protein JXB31_04715 [Candidatus Woesearchaeota archaeon]|nr:hypothetical protein [Candidatus Woesearchaeota archaeon]
MYALMLMYMTEIRIIAVTVKKTAFFLKNAFFLYLTATPSPLLLSGPRDMVCLVLSLHR